MAAPAGYCEGVLEGGLAEAVADGVVLGARGSHNAEWEEFEESIDAGRGKHNGSKGDNRRKQAARGTLMCSVWRELLRCECEHWKTRG